MLSKYFPNEIAHESLPDPAWPLSVVPQRLVGLTKILLALNHPYDLAGREHRSTPSIGITLFGEMAHNVDDLLKQADLAMFQAKSAGRNTLRFLRVTLVQYDAPHHLRTPHNCP